MSENLCVDNRFELIEKYKQKLIEATNIETSPEEMAVIDNILFRFWQMGWLPPIPHGRLIDADALDKQIYNDIPLKVFGNIARMAEMRNIVFNAPTVIPAEEE